MFLILYLKSCISSSKIYSKFSYYSFRNGYGLAAFWFLLSSLSALFLLRPLVEIFEDMAVIYLDAVSFDIIGQDMFGDE